MSGPRPMRETITAALKHATKLQDKRRISTLRLVSAAIKDRDIAARTAGKTQATDAELLDLFAKMIKQREESQKIYADAGRAELAKQEGEEIEIIREFLPKQFSNKEMEKAIAAAIAESGASSVTDMGKVMAALKARYAGQMDFAKASALVKSKLS
ncbi:MAG TPA: GatB/YqeY domain-containing protein [Methyloceanibacter sp.]|nr:GatB/YqeY domain-containing protein [Methyloceanibacter sp.]